MEFELFLILALIILLLTSCCGLFNKLKQASEETESGLSVTSSNVAISTYQNSAYLPEDQIPNAVFPTTFSLSSYLEYMEPPPKYEDLFKENGTEHLNETCAGTQNEDQAPTTRINVAQ